MAGSPKKALPFRNLAGLKTRPARALIGWMSTKEAYVVLSLPPAPAKPIPDLALRIWEARAAVESRRAGVDQSHALADPGEELRGVQDRFQRDPHYQAYRSAGGTLKIANLNEICAVQPIVHMDYVHRTDRFSELIRCAREDDIPSSAEITLPPPPPLELPAHFDPATNAWTFRSMSPNTSIVGQFSTRVEMSPGVFAMGMDFAFDLCLPLCRLCCTGEGTS
jgi:hypothetical protein